MTSIELYRDSLSDEAPPANFDPALQGLWWAGKHDWDRAHGCVQQHEGDRRCDWVHAHLHRIEGDLTNAGYWYRQAGQQMATVPTDQEWEQIAVALLPGAEGKP